jgi:hypothetical protein
MLDIRKAGDRGFADHGSLRSFHSFFADYYDPRHVHFPIGSPGGREASVVLLFDLP